MAVGTSYLLAAAWAQPLAAFSIAVTGAINGAGRMIPPMIIDTVGYLFVLIPCASLYVACVPDASIESLWGLWVAAHVLIGIAYWVYVERVDGWLEPVRRRPDTLSG